MNLGVLATRTRAAATMIKYRAASSFDLTPEICFLDFSQAKLPGRRAFFEIKGLLPLVRAAGFEGRRINLHEVAT